MSYTTGSADSYADLLAKIRVIGEAAGWVTKAANATGWVVSSADGNANYVVAIVSSNDSTNTPFWNYNSFGPCIAVSNCKSIDVGASLWNQPGQDFRDGKDSHTACLCFGNGVAGPFAKFYAFATDQYIHVVVEAITGTFGHLLMGNLDKDGAVYDGGSYNGATQCYRPVNSDITQSDSTGNGLSQPFALYPFSYRYPYNSASRVRVENVDNIGVNKCDVFYDTSGTTEGVALGPWASGWNSNGYLSTHPDCGLVEASANNLGGNTMMIPTAIYHYGAQGRLRYIGVIPDQAVCNMQFLAPGDIITYGTDEWQVFPVLRKGTDSLNGTLNAGVAYRIRR